MCAYFVRQHWSLRYSLRLLFLLLTLLAFLFVWIGTHYRSAKRQRAAVSELQHMGADTTLERGPNNIGNAVLRLTIGNHAVDRLSAVQFTDLDLTGTTLDCLHDVEWVSVVAFDGCTLDESALTNVVQLPKLQTLYVRYCTIPADAVEVMSECKSIRVLCLYGKNIGDDHICSLRRMPQLANLHLKDSNVSDLSMKHLMHIMPGLRTLDLRFTAITDEGINTISEHPSIEVLNLVGTRVTDQAVLHVAEMVSLGAVMLEQTSVTEQAVRQLRLSRPSLMVTWESGGNVPR
jgi:hypothetical protein